jgi:FMN reductase (NADPH)
MVATLSETMRTLARHVSIHDFLPDPIDDSTIVEILQAARRAPTSSNLQAYSFVVVRKLETRAELATLAGDQRHVEEAPVFVAVCADLSRAEAACNLHGQPFRGDTLEMGLVATVDAALAGMAASLAAESLGLGTVMIGGMRNHPVEVARLLRLPPRAFVPFGLCIGWPARRPPVKPRMPERAVIHFERYDGGEVGDALAAYDQALAVHYRAQDRTTCDASWTHQVAHEFSSARRGDLRTALRELGFEFS